MLHLCCCSVAKSCPTLCDLMDCRLPGFSVRGVFQARILEWVAVPSSKGSSWPRDRTCVSYTGRWVTASATIYSVIQCVCACVCVCVCVLATLIVRFSGIKYIHNVVQSSPLSISKTSLSQMIPWTARRSNQSILNKINPEYSSEGLLLKLQYFESEKWRWKSLSHVQLFATPWTIQSMEFSRPES